MGRRGQGVEGWTSAVRGNQRLKLTERLIVGNSCVSPALPITRDDEDILRYIYIDVYIIYIKKFSCLHRYCSRTVHHTNRTALSTALRFFCKFFFLKVFCYSCTRTLFKVIFVYGQQKLTRVKVKNDLDLVRSKCHVNLSTSRFFF